MSLTVRWTSRATFGHKGHFSGALLRSRISARWWDLGERRSVWRARLPLLLALHKMHALPSSGKAFIVSSGLGTFGCPEPFSHVERAELRSASCEHYKTSVHAVTANSTEESSHHFFDGDPERVDPLEPLISYEVKLPLLMSFHCSEVFFSIDEPKVAALSGKECTTGVPRENRRDFI